MVSDSEWVELDMPPAMQAPVRSSRGSSEARRRAISRIEASIEGGDRSGGVEIFMSTAVSKLDLDDASAMSLELLPDDEATDARPEKSEQKGRHVRRAECGLLADRES